MANTRVKDLANTATSVASDAYHVIDGTTNGTEKITRDNLRTDMASAFAADPGTYNLAPLAAGAVEVAKGGTGSTTAAGARTNLSVNSVDEDAEATGTKLVGPALYFNGTSSVVTVADDAKFSFTDGSDDLPFSISFWVKHDFSASGTNVMFGKYGLAASAREWWFYFTSDLLYFSVVDSAGVESFSRWSVADNSNKWTHICLTQDAAGPNSSNSFSAVADGMSLYVNGQLVSPTSRYNDASYAGMADSSQPLWFGKSSSSFGGGEYRSFTFHNRELTATEVAQLARGTDLGFSDEWGDHTTDLVTDGDMEAAGTTNWASSNATVTKETADPYAGTRNLKCILNGSSTGYVETAPAYAPVAAGKRYRAVFYYRTGGTAPSAYSFRGNGSSWQTISTLSTAASWTRHEVEFVVNSSGNGRLTFHIEAGTDADTYIEVDGFEVVAIGTLADFRAERFDSSTNKLYDLSDNSFIGTNNGAQLVGREVPVYETGTWNGVYEPTTGSFTTMTMDTDLIYTRIGNLVTVTGSIQTDNVDTTGGSGSLKITGLPFFAAKVSTCQIGFAWNWGTNFPLSAVVSGSTILLYTRSSTTARTDDILVTDLSTGASANRNTLYISATYKIS